MLFLSWFGCREFKFEHFLSVFSVLRNLVDSSVAKIVFHTDCVPKSDYWNDVLNLAEHRILIQRLTIQNSNSTYKYSIFKTWPELMLSKIEHVSDIYRIYLLYRFGGIYLDDDVVLINKHDKYLNNTRLTLGQTSPASLANGFMISPVGSRQLLRWLQEYKYYQPILHGPFSTMKVMALTMKFPGETHIVQRKWIVPNFLTKLKVFFRENSEVNPGFNWKFSENIHLGLRYLRPEIVKRCNVSFEQIRDIECMDNSLGEFVRYIFFGDWNLC